MRQPLPRTLALARDLARFADEDKSAARIAVADRSLGYSLLILGEVREADKILSRGAALADTLADPEFAVYGEHPSMVCRAYGAQAKILGGFPTSGAQLAESAVAFARRQDNAHSLAWALNVAALVFQSTTSQRQPPALPRRLLRQHVNITCRNGWPTVSAAWAGPCIGSAISTEASTSLCKASSGGRHRSQIAHDLL